MLHVAVAVIRDAQGRMLLSRRPSGTHLAGLWEFPGGKLEAGENLGDGLKREINEELGLKINKHRPLIQIMHHYPERSVMLDVHLVESWAGSPVGREGQQIAWVSLDEMHRYDLPPADRPIITALKLPSIYRITPADAANPLLKKLPDIEDCLIQLRLPGVSIEVQRRIIESIREVDDKAQLLVKDIALAQSHDCGLHLRSADLMQLDGRPLPAEQLVAASCHTHEELAHAERIGIDFVTLSPVLQTQSHPQAIPLGWEEFNRMATQTRLPVYALGGVDPSYLQTAWNAGAQGVAGISAFWRF